VDYSRAIFKPPLIGPEGWEGDGKRPVIFDILGPDRLTSILPLEYRLVLWANPSEMSLSYSRKVERIQTRGGFVEQHWGDDTQSISFTAVTGGFMRLFSGLSNVTSPELGGTRRDTLAYDRYLDFLALFHNNGSVYDVAGQVGLQGIIKVTFDGGSYLGWFNSFNVTESADKPFMFSLTADFDIADEIQVWRTQAGGRTQSAEKDAYGAATKANEFAFDAVNPEEVSHEQFVAAMGSSMSEIELVQAARHGTTYIKNPDGTYMAVTDD
jgi:hypothetical protein